MRNDGHIGRVFCRTVHTAAGTSPCARSCRRESAAGHCRQLRRQTLERLFCRTDPLW